MMVPTSITVLSLSLFVFGVSSLPYDHICPPDGEIVAPHETSCTKYISCVNGTGEVLNCRNGTIFDYEAGDCMKRDETECNLCQFNTKPVRLIPFEGDCHKYFICYGSRPAERECYDGLHFNSALAKCDDPATAECEQNESEEESDNEAPIQCRDDAQEEFLPSLVSCDDYFHCVNKTPTKHNCGVGFIWNIEANSCNRTGRCIHDYVPLCESSNTNLPHLHDCRHYYFCDPNETQPKLRACPLGELFDRTQLQCVPENEANCGSPTADELESWPTSDVLKL